MSWIRRKLSQVKASASPATIGDTRQSLDPNIIRYDVFKSHWFQIADIINAVNYPLVNTQSTVVNQHVFVTQDNVDAVRNLLEQIIYLMVEEQNCGLQLGPILEYAITECLLDQMYLWCEKSEQYKEQIAICQIKVYEVLISQAQTSLLHHRQLVNPMLKLLSLCSHMESEEVDSHVVLLLNLLCVWITRDPTLLDIFFRLSDDQGPANFLIFSLLIDFIHREGGVGQQARDALLLCMTLSSENEKVAEYIVSTNFCPVLATGLSGLYSSLPHHMDVRADDWHFLRKNDWNHVPSLVNFMNCLEFCNSVAEAAHPIVTENLLNYIHNGFLVSVLGPALHKLSANEVIVTTAYLNLFLQSVTVPSLIQCFLQFLLCHRHDNALIINTLIQRIGSNSRLALVSLSLFRTLIELNCEDLMLHLVFRYLIPCRHILASQIRSMCDVDMYNASASRFIGLSFHCQELPSKNGTKEHSIFHPIRQIKTVQSTIKHNDTNQTSETPPRKRSSTDDGNDLNGLKEISESCTSDAASSAPADEAVENVSSTNETLDDAAADDHVLNSVLPDVSNAVSEYTVNEDLSVTINMHPASENTVDHKESSVITSLNTMAEFGPDLDSQISLCTSYMDYLEDANSTIESCSLACAGWSEPYDGKHPPVDIVDKLFSGGLHSSTPILSRNLDADFRGLTKPYSVSEPPIPLSASKMMARSSDQALDALTATYQTLSITAQALGDNNNINSVLSKPLNGKDVSAVSSTELKLNEHGNDREETNCIQESNSNETNSDKNRNVGLSIEVSTTETKENSKSTAESSTEQSAYENVANREVKMISLQDEDDKDKLSLPLENNKIENDNKHRISTADPAKSPVLSPVVSYSTVDEFFRALMDSVPKNALDSAAEGYGVSGSGKETNHGDDMVQAESAGNQPWLDEDDTETNKMNDAEKHANGDEDSNEDDSSFNQSFDDEDGDTVSVSSSSFYEPDLEYSPTELSLTPLAPLKMHAAPYTGPFLSTLFGKLDQMISNSLYENLLLTGIISRLACYPQPLLRSFLLNTSMVFHPAVRSLYQVLAGVRNQIDNYASGVGDFNVLLQRAQKYLLSRGQFPFTSSVQNSNDVEDIPMPVPKVKTKNTLLGEVFLRRKKRRTRIPKLGTLLEQGSNVKLSMGINKAEIKPKLYVFPWEKSSAPNNRGDDARTKNAVYSAIVINEFLKELAAISQEHAVIHV